MFQSQTFYIVLIYLWIYGVDEITRKTQKRHFFSYLTCNICMIGKSRLYTLPCIFLLNVTYSVWGRFYLIDSTIMCFICLFFYLGSSQGMLNKKTVVVLPCFDILLAEFGPTSSSNRSYLSYH